jgi:uncharacterized protein YjbJ (UPF0337 family)
MWAIEAAGAKGFSRGNRACKAALLAHYADKRKEWVVGHELGSHRRQLEAAHRQVKEQWGKLTEDDLTVIGGKQDQLVGRIQERYGIAKDEAERQVNTWVNRM